MSLNPFQVQASPAANITDLHAFIVDKAGKLVTEGDPSATGDQLIISLCVQRALQPTQVSRLDLKGFKFRVHLDLQPPVRFFDEALTREGRDYVATLGTLNKEVEKTAAALDAAKRAADKAGEDRAETKWKDALASRGTLISQHEGDRSMQALYGGIIAPPDAIADDAQMEFELGLVKDGDASQPQITGTRFDGIPGKVNVVAKEKLVDGKVRISGNAFQRGVINVQTGVFDDPFIFPRFFRRNVVGIVTSIPLAALRDPARHGPIFLWATTHDAKGVQIDHVGRSLRTQLPRFGYLNTKHPADHVKVITQVHDKPTVMEDVLATMLAPLEAHRHYDSAPDVMVYDLTKPARFPNGRWLEDDVSKTLADAGETLLLELSYAESKQFPRATTNDKEFQNSFPYLAPPWTKEEIEASAQRGATMGGYPVPLVGDPAAIAFANFKPATWKTLWLLLVAGVLMFTILLLLTVSSNLTRVFVGIVAIITICLLHAVIAPNLPTADLKAVSQPFHKLTRLILGVGVIAVFGIAWIFALGRRFGYCKRDPEPFPPGNQDVSESDLPTATHCYDEVKRAVFETPYYGNAWGGPDRRTLPVYTQTVSSLLRGIFPLGMRIFRQAAKRTVRSHADLRWGVDNKGFRRLLHPMGICLSGTWKIAGAPENTRYTGFFAPGSEGRILARYSTGGSKPWGGNYRSLALVGKIYPKGSGSEVPLEGPAHFFTQEDLGASFTNSIREAIITNSPPVSPWNRGKDVVFLLINGLTLLLADTKNTERQLYEIAELGKPKETPTSCPRFMKLTVSADTPKLGGDDQDFRDEIMGIIYDRADPKPKRKLVFDISVSDSGKKWKLGVEFLTGLEWTKIGQIVFDDAAASYNGDFVIHFHHPVWRIDRNDPNTIKRADLRRR